MSNSSPASDCPLVGQHYEKHVADRISIVAQDFLSDREILSGKCTVDTRVDLILRGLVVQLESYMLGEHRDTVSVHESWPATWRDAFKERWFPHWLKRWFPVEYNRIDIDRPIYGPVCPHLHAPKAKHFEWMSYGAPATQEPSA